VLSSRLTAFGGDPTLQLGTSPKELIAQIVPAGAGFADAAVGDHVDDLYPEEVLRIAKAVPKRRREFSTGRLVARRALSAIGGPTAAIPSGAHGEPLWPPAFTGSITHTAAHAAAVVGRAQDFQGIGIDAEIIDRMSLSLASAIATDQENEWLRVAPEPLRLLALIYSAKESWFKCQYPTTDAYLGFDDVIVQFDWSGGAFDIRSTRECPGVELMGRARSRFTFDDHHVATVVTLPATPL
jgi:4'-phosphopantetheinyl transferase EntD